ncbi:MAG: hypothetical protein ABIN94_00510 [Ferruginibacter sp.]
MKTTGIILIVLFMLTGCSPESSIDRYNKLEKKELASGKRADSIFFGISLGMPQKKFFLYCWEMNKKGIFSDGADDRGVMCVLYKLDTQLHTPATMNFYPEFNDSAIWKMRSTFQYKGWAPWNKHLGADSLLPDVLSMYKKWYSYGNPFIEITDEKKGVKYVKVDGNRRITIKKTDDVIVEANYTDMLVEKKIGNKHEQ